MKIGIIRICKEKLLTDWYKAFCKEFTPIGIRSEDYSGTLEIQCLSEHFEEVKKSVHPPHYKVSMEDGYFSAENITKREINDEISRLKKKIEDYEKIINTSIIFKKDEVLRDWSTQFERTIVLRTKS